jgi:hypothetical protein
MYVVAFYPPPLETHKDTPPYVVTHRFATHHKHSYTILSVLCKGLDTPRAMCPCFTPLGGHVVGYTCKIVAGCSWL